MSNLDGSPFKNRTASRGLVEDMKDLLKREKPCKSALKTE